MSVPSSLDATSARNGHGRRGREVVTADRGHQFAWEVVEPPTRARWGYSFVAVPGGTEVTETWELPPEGSAFFENMFGADAGKEIGTYAATRQRTVLGRRWPPSRERPRAELHAPLSVPDKHRIGRAPRLFRVTRLPRVAPHSIGPVRRIGFDWRAPGIEPGPGGQNSDCLKFPAELTR